MQWLLAAILLVTALAPAVASASEPCRNGQILLQKGMESVRDFGGCISYLEDAGQLYLLPDILALEPERFTRHESGVLNFGYTESAYWTRFDLRTDTGEAGSDWILELALPLVDEVVLYLVRDGELVDQRTAGYQDNWAERDLAVPNPTFRLHLEPGSVTSVYLRIINTNTFRLPVSLWSPDSYIEKVSVDEMVRGALLGSLLAILAYNLFVAISVRERSNIYYVLYLVSAAVFIATEQVHGVQLLDSRPAIFSKEYLHFQIITTWFWGLLMARALLETRARSMDLDRVIKLCISSVLLTFVLSLFLPYHVAMEWIVIGSMLLCIILIVVSYLSWRYYNPAARSYFFAWTLALIGFGIYALTVMGYLPLNTFTGYAPQIGLTAQIILFSFALADRIKQVQGQALNWSRRALSNLQRYQSLFDNAIEGVFQMSPGRQFVTANPAMARLMGFDNSQELLENNPDVLEACIADSQLRELVVEQLEARGTVKGVEARYLTNEGKERWAIISLHTAYDADGEPTHLEGTCVDSTESHRRQRIEREREQERLEKELARNSAEAKSQFLANMSHEIRTPLSAIIGYGETLMDPDLDEQEKRSSAETVVRSGRHLLDLVNDILDHSKIDANKLDLDVVSVNLPDLLDEIRAFFAPRAREKGLTFNIDCEFPLPEQIQTDPTRLRQIIINLCGNALKFTEKGSISLLIRCDCEQELLVARVVDTGIGMKPEQVGRLFDPFAQGSAAISRQYGGTGLGLSISRRLTEMLGGSIRVSSTYGEGSEFELSIRTGALNDVHFLQDASELSRRRRSIPVVVAPRLSGRILCAEDNDVNRRLVSLLVGRTGAELVHVGNGAEALEVAVREPFDLILMDIQMPVMNGRDATAALREAGVNTPVIALTANVMSEDIADYRLAGCNEHLAKPIDKQRFYQVLARYLKVQPGSVGEPDQQYHGCVLVAEANEERRHLVVRMLKPMGPDVIAVASGAEAVRKALSESVQLVLLGRYMPEMNRVDATQLLRQAGFRYPVIAVGAADQQEINVLREAGCDEVLDEALDEQRLHTLLERFLTYVPRSEETVYDDEEIARLATRFLSGLGGRWQRMSLALASGDQATLETETHQIKGSAGAMGYPAMTRQAGIVEALVKGTSPQWEQVRTELAILGEMIEREQTQNKKGRVQ
ncbi:7TM diverse intracellular signaling domain-containing protein [Marinobacter sp. 2_MG-2023]|uniref:7TM diverse intracellular signaling domain-containing protein n=1 Tax=Marinobacter sp. 2_MG-2023 TaxID=3062679 RepID=UPI0026E44121|nr:7TM diverse intracellular signaling domain-containing protein [Marinobacter sp. 2_MG-2023]MDO6441876.1 7TM diverse intracellular signaling domain-containing protein [Marinobacter sp. 2_MG-2023]